MIKFTKNLLFNPAEICISGIRCNFDNIAKISTIFDFKWTEVTIDSVKEGSSLLEFVKVQGLKNFITDNRGSNFISVIQNQSADIEPVYHYYACINNMDSEYVITLNGEDIKLPITKYS